MIIYNYGRFLHILSLLVKKLKFLNSPIDNKITFTYKFFSFHIHKFVYLKIEKKTLLYIFLLKK